MKSVKVKPFLYSSGKTPKGYACHDCGAKDVKLWREYNTFLDHQSLRCFECACKDQKKKPSDLDGDQVGWLVPAVPTEEGDRVFAVVIENDRHVLAV